MKASKLKDKTTHTITTNLSYEKLIDENKRITIWKPRGEPNEELTELFNLIRIGKIDLKNPTLENIPDWLFEKISGKEDEEISEVGEQVALLLYAYHKATITNNPEVQLTDEELVTIVSKFTAILGLEELKRKGMILLEMGNIFDENEKFSLSLTEKGAKFMDTMFFQGNKEN